jgi:hypothetical protein
MKKLILIILLLSACRQVPKKYTVEFTGSNESTTIDSVFADDDNEGYRKGVFLYYGHLIADSLLHYKTERTTDFTVRNPDGINLTIKLPLKTIDSINKIAVSVARGLRSRH